MTKNIDEKTRKAVNELATGLAAVIAKTKRERQKRRKPQKTEFEIQGDYGQGFELETCEETISEARARLKEYRENMPQYPHRIKRVRAAE